MTPTSHNPGPIHQELPRSLSPERTTQLLLDLGRIRELVAECLITPSECKEALLCQQIREVSLPLCQLSLTRVVEVLNSSAQCADGLGLGASEVRLKAYAEVVDDVICYIENLRDGYQDDEDFLEGIAEKMALSGASFDHYGKPCLQNCPVGVMADFINSLNGSLRDLRSVLSQWQEVPDHQPLASEFLRQLHALKGAVLVYGVEELAGNIQYLESCAVAFLKGELEACKTLFELLDRYVTRMNVVADLLVQQQGGGLSKSVEAVLPLSDDVGEALQPLSQKLPRLRFLVERASAMLGKPVRLMVTGEDVALPVALVSKLVVPLELLLWNAIDHGIELPAERVEAGKSADGVIELSFRLENDGALCVVTVADDGAGINEAAVRKKALTVGCVASCKEADEKPLTEMIFHPGLSTLSVVSPVSGRGVGLDVVKTEVSHLDGNVQVQSAAGKGASFTLVVPL